jgi:chaperone BCS1
MNEYTAPKDKVICRLFIFGITNSITKSFLRDIKQTHKEWFNGTYTNFYKMIVIGKDFSENMVFKPHRYRSTLFGNDLAIDALTTKLDYFLNNKEWYIEKGIPYKFNILLHGSPGVGKTSIIHFLASYIGRPLIVPGRFLNRLNELDLNDKLVILEDLDAEFLSANSKRPKDEDDEEDMFSSSDSKDLKLSTLLNLLDGLQTPDGLITSITTNNLEAFDAALLRPGRIDCILEIVPLNKSSVIDMLTHFNVSVDHCKLKNDILVPAANLQEIILGHLSHPYHHLESRINEACIKKLYES